MANTFPTSLNDWTSGETIESSWADALETKIGIDGSADTNSLDYKVAQRVVGQASSVDSEIALFSGTGGKTIKRATTTGILKGASGVISAASAGTDYIAPGAGNADSSVTDAAADGATKGKAAFTANDFNASSGVISIDYTNGQKATDAQPGFLTELATSTETTTGTDATRAVTPDGLAGSTIFGVKVVELQIVADETDVDTTSGIAYFRVPQAMNGMNLIRAQADVTTAGTTNATTIQVRNMTKYSSNDALSSAISVASGGTLATAGTVNTSYDDVATDDLVKVYVTAQSTTKPKGLRVWCEYQLP